MRLFMALGVAVWLAVWAEPAWAARMRVHEAADSPRYGTKLVGMLGRGLLNVGTCFVDVLTNTVN